MNLSAENSTPQRAVVLVVDKYSQDVHLASLTAGVKYPVKFSKRLSSISTSSLAMR